MTDKQPDRDPARREPIFEDDERQDWNKDEFAHRRTLDDDYGGNRGMDDQKDKLDKSKNRQTRTEQYTRSKGSNIDQDISQTV
jgi:hypothetical protein